MFDKTWFDDEDDTYIEFLGELPTGHLIPRNVFAKDYSTESQDHRKPLSY